MEVDYVTALRIAKRHYPEVVDFTPDNYPTWNGARYLATKKSNVQFFFVPSSTPIGAHGMKEPGYYRYDPRRGFVKEYDAPSRMDEVGGIWINGTLIANEAAVNGGGR